MTQKQTQKRMADIFNVTLPQQGFNLGRLHFVGIGGIGMSGIAEILLSMGCVISGSDIKKSDITTRLQTLGAHICIGHCGKNVHGADAIVVSTAIKSDNPEYVYASKHRIPIVHRSEMLAEIMRLKVSISIAGTHGKTTTTSLVAHALINGGVAPTVVNGGILNNLGSNATFGAGDWFVAEADESDGSFTRLPTTIAVVTNMDAEHMDFYTSYDHIKTAFLQFVENIPFYGCAILCADHTEVQKMAMQITNRRIVTYGLNPQVDIRGVNIKNTPMGTTLDVITPHGDIMGLVLPLRGTYNIQNALASVAVALEVGIDIDKMASLYMDFKGVKRRFTHTGYINGAKVIDDYAHHPVEIKAVLEAGRANCEGKLYAVVQPHRYTRLQILFEDFCTCFNEADCVIITPIYPAGESPIDGITHESLAMGISASGHNHVQVVDDFQGVYDKVSHMVTADDMVIYMGAGDITTYAHNAGVGKV